MKLCIIRSKWDLDEIPLETFLSRIKEAGFDGSEIHLPSIRETPEDCVALHRSYDLRFVAMTTTEGRTPADHMRSLEERLALAAQYQPMRINIHTGKDYFPPEENRRIIERSLALSADIGIPVSHETHRGRATFSTMATQQLLQQIPGMRLTADFSHWCCVHESLLHDQPEALSAAIERADYIHARVGHIEGPQISDPRAPEWQTELETHFAWWLRIADAHRKRGTEHLAVCPEFGPPPYMQTLPCTRQPVASVWDVTMHMMQILRAALAE
jgi:sugar phosphate isomerase/epimerase